jgi:hypothetical protein
MLRRSVVLMFVAVLSAISAGAQEDEWGPVSAGPITTWTAPVCGKGKLVVHPFFVYGQTRGFFNDSGDYEALPEGDHSNFFQEQLLLQYGLNDSWELAGQVFYQQSYVKQGPLEASANGVGDSLLFLRYCISEEKDALPHIAAMAQLKVPTGKYQNADPALLGADIIGAGSWDPGIGINLTKKYRPFMLHGDAIYSVPQEAEIDGARTTYAQYLNYDLALEYFLPRGVNLMFEANGFASSDSSYITLVPAIGWSNETLQTLLGYQRVLSGTNSDANDSVVFTFVYTFEGGSK